MERDEPARSGHAADSPRLAGGQVLSLRRVRRVLVQMRVGDEDVGDAQEFAP
jgi:hypothetical protein